MRYAPTPLIGRRSVVGGLALVGASVIAPGLARADTKLFATPRQTKGPFYPVDWSGDADNDLVRVQGEAARALGEVVHVAGRILGVDGAPLPGARVEIWQCDAKGVYRHPGVNRGSRRVDAAFQGRGRVVADGAGRYAFRTLRPVAYSGRTPNIHFRVVAGEGRALDTQMYVLGDPLTPGDRVRGSLSAREREAVTVRLDVADAIEPGAKAGAFDIVLA